MKEKFFKSNFSPKRLSVYLSICLSILGIGNANAQTTLSETFNWEANCGIGDATGSARVYLSDEGQFTFIQTKIGSGVSIASNANYMQLTSSQTLDVFSTDADRVITSVVITTSSTTTMGYMSGASVKASTSLASYASASVISPTITTDGTAFVVTYDFDYENGYKYLQIQSTGTARIYKIEVKYAVNTDYYYKLYSITDFTDVTAFSTTNAQTNPTTSNVQTKTTPNNAISAISNVGTVQMTNKGGLKIGANNNNSASLSVTLLQTTDRVVIVGTGYANGNTAFTFNGNSSPFDSYSPNNMAEYSLCYLKDTKVFDMSPAANNFTLGNNSSNRNVIYRIYTFQKVYLPSSCTTPPSLGTVVEGEAPTSNSVSLMAELAYQVDCAVTEYGFVYNTTGNPTIADNKVTSSDLDDDIFSKEVTGLTCGTAYYFRAYAINGAGISYSEQYNASTAAPLYSVTLNNAGVTSQLSQTSCDETLTLPPATPPCAGWEFAGWTETNVSQITVTPTFITEYTPSANGTVFYAVFSKVAVTLPNYTSPTSTANKFVIAAKIGTTYYAIPSDYTFTLSTYGRINSTVVETLENNGSVYVNFDAGGYAWIIQSTASGFKITNTDGSKYLAYNSSTYLQITTTAQYWTITDGSTGLLRITNQTTIDRGLGFNKDSDQLKFGCYAVSNLNNATSGYCDIELLPVSEQTVTYSSTPLCPAVLTWTGVTTDWTTASNWSPAQVPTTIDSVTIAAADVYPAIPENTEVASLTIAPNAEIYNQANLSTNTKVFVQYDLSGLPIGSYGTLLSLPLKEGYGIDFTFASYPKVAIKYWGTPTAAGFIKWDNATQITPLSYTSNNAFFFRISDSGASPTQGLLANENILTLPYYETAGQTFNPTVNNYDVTRTTAAYQLANAEVTQSLVFAKDVILNSNFALAGNPFMSSIDFATLQTDHSTLIKSNYRLWDKSSSNYNVYSEDGVSISEIPTKTGFVVEQYDGADAIGSLVFPLALTATASSVSPAPQLTNNANKLFFTATNEYGTSPISVITKRPYGSDLFGNADAGMLLSETDIPQVYTLKPNAAGATVGAAINVISANNAIIPLAIKSDYNGATTLNFSGMDNYQDAIYLLDYTTGAEINLSQTAEYAYEFVNAGSSNSRFAIAIRQPVPTTIANNATDNILVLNLNGTIEIKSIDKIEQVQIFTATGALVYSSANGNTISTSLLPTGIYNIKVRTTKDIAVKKIKL